MSPALAGRFFTTVPPGKPKMTQSQLKQEFVNRIGGYHKSQMQGFTGPHEGPVPKTRKSRSRVLSVSQGPLSLWCPVLVYWQRFPCQSDSLHTDLKQALHKGT